MNNLLKKYSEKVPKEIQNKRRCLLQWKPQWILNLLQPIKRSKKIQLEEKMGEKNQEEKVWTRVKASIDTEFTPTNLFPGRRWIEI